MITIEVKNMDEPILLNFPNEEVIISGKNLLEAISLYLNTKAEMEEENGTD